MDEQLSAINNNVIAGTLFIDLSTSFDLNYDNILEKLKLYGMHETTVKWFSSYLKCRYQETYVSGTLSNCGKVVSGVLSECIVDIFAADYYISSQQKH